MIETLLQKLASHQDLGRVRAIGGAAQVYMSVCVPCETSLTLCSTRWYGGNPQSCLPCPLWTHTSRFILTSAPTISLCQTPQLRRTSLRTHTPSLSRPSSADRTIWLPAWGHAPARRCSPRSSCGCGKPGRKTCGRVRGGSSSQVRSCAV